MNTLYNIELTEEELNLVSKVLNKEVNATKDIKIMGILSKLSNVYYEPLVNEIGEFITKKFNIK